MLDNELALHGTSALWLSRAFAPLHDGSICLLLTLVCLYSLLVTSYTVASLAARMRRFHAALWTCESDADAASPAFWVRQNKLPLRALCAASLACQTGSMAVALADACIAATALSSERGARWTAPFVADVAALCAFLTLLFLAAFVLVPALQLAAAVLVLRKTFPASAAADAAADPRLPRLRIASAALYHAWAVACFVAVAMWPPARHATVRFFVFEAAWGSSLLWGHVARRLCFYLPAGRRVEGAGLAFRGPDKKDARLGGEQWAGAARGRVDEAEVGLLAAKKESF
ncbi:hypothetical protein LTR04_003145 [Oleoguttula sp. CCFEE 6159]|nr:hypothetical protein LTR04_003145 [Oleoguttula sp. CCFEE 6159]